MVRKLSRGHCLKKKRTNVYKKKTVHRSHTLNFQNPHHRDILAQNRINDTKK